MNRLLAVAALLGSTLGCKARTADLLESEQGDIDTYGEMLAWLEQKKPNSIDEL